MSATISVGWTGKVPTMKYHSHAGIPMGWHVTVIDITSDGRFAKVRGGANFGKARWVEAKSIQNPEPPVFPVNSGGAEKEHTP